MNGVRLAPLLCAGCGAPVPLPDTLGPRAETPCRHCHAMVPIAPEHAAAIRAIGATAAARRAAEPLWQALTAQPPAGVAVAGLAMVVLLPVIATLLAALVPYPPLGRVEIYALVTVPALAPGAALYLWAAAVNATLMRFRDALSAQPARPGGSDPTCRLCGAPVAVGPDAIAVTCGYCGADNLVADVPGRSLQRGLREAVRTLDEAMGKLRARKVMLGMGAIAVTAAIAGASLLLWTALGV